MYSSIMNGAQNAAQITPTIGNLPSPVIKTYQGTGRSTAGAITATGVNVGDVISGALCWTTSTGAVVGLNTTQFVGPVSTTNQIPQTGATDISLQTCLFFVQPRS